MADRMNDRLSTALMCNILPIIYLPIYIFVCLSIHMTIFITAETSASSQMDVAELHVCCWNFTAFLKLQSFAERPEFKWKDRWKRPALPIVDLNHGHRDIVPYLYLVSQNH